MKQKFVLITSILVGLLAAFLARAWIDTNEKRYQEALERVNRQEEKISVVIAGRDLPTGTVIAKTDLLKAPFSRSALRDDYIPETDSGRILGKKLVNTLTTANPIFWTDIEGGDTRARTLSDDVQQGMRAVSIPVSGAAAVSGMVRPNDSVDVLGSFALPNTASGAMEMELVTLTVLQNVTVIATGSDTFRTLSQNNRSASSYSTVTLLVTPREAEVLVFAQQMKGRLALSLRNRQDVQFEAELPRVDFNQIESELKTLNDYRQRVIRRVRTAQ